jgi:hypothetical protein
MESNSSIEKIGTGLVCSLETFKGAKIELVIEYQDLTAYQFIKMEKLEKLKSRQCITQINGLPLMEFELLINIFFERDYWIYLFYFRRILL